MYNIGFHLLLTHNTTVFNKEPAIVLKTMAQ